MANMLENFGLDFFSEDDNSLMGFVGYPGRKSSDRLLRNAVFV